MSSIKTKITVFEYTINNMFNAQNTIEELELHIECVDDYSVLICQSKDAFINKYQDQMSPEQIEAIYAI